MVMFNFSPTPFSLCMWHVVMPLTFAYRINMRLGKRYVKTNRRKHPHFLTSFSILVAEGQSAEARAAAATAEKEN